MRQRPALKAELKGRELPGEAKAESERFSMNAAVCKVHVCPQPIIGSFRLEKTLKITESEEEKAERGPNKCL